MAEQERASRERARGGKRDSRFFRSAGNEAQQGRLAEAIAVLVRGAVLARACGDDVVTVFEAQAAEHRRRLEGR